jgi:hypothetical protein
MAEISVEQKKGGNHTWIWATLAVVAVVGLMVWLASQDVATAPVAVEEDTAAEGATVAGNAEAAELPAIAADPAGFSGRPLSVTAVPVAATLGTRAFWADIPGANPFLVVVTPEAATPGLIEAGQTVNLQGSVAAVTPELVDQWVQEGAVQPASREEATFATHYLLADQLAAGAAPAAQQQQP